MTTGANSVARAVLCSVWPLAGERGCDVTDGDGKQNDDARRSRLCLSTRIFQASFLTRLVALLFRCLYGTARKTAMQTITAGACGRTGSGDHKCATMYTIVVATSSVGLHRANFQYLSAKKVCFGGALLVLEDQSRALARCLGSEERCTLTFSERTLLTPARSNRAHPGSTNCKH